MDDQQSRDSFRRRNGFYYGTVLPGVWMVVIGVFFLLNNFGFLNGDVWGMLWPLFIIIPGVFMLLRPRRD